MVDMVVNSSQPIGIWVLARDARVNKAAEAPFSDLEYALYNTIISKVIDASKDGYPPALRDVFDDTAIFELDGTVYRIGYKYEAEKAELVGEPVQVEASYTSLPSEPETGPAKTEKRFVKISKVGSPEDERYVLGIVLVPEDVDSQGDIYSAEEIKRSAWEYMKHFRNVGLMHKGLLNGRVSLVESYIAPIDMEINGSNITKGTWLLGLHVEDDELWAKVKKGELGGLSMGGFANRTPLED